MRLIDALLSEFSTQLSRKDIHFKGSIPPKKLQGAISAYATGVKPEDILFLFDGTIFGSAKEGIAATADSLHWNISGSGPSSASFEKISRIEHFQGKMIHTIRLNEYLDIKPAGLDVEQTKALAKFIDKLVQIRKISLSATSKPDAVATSRNTPAATAVAPVPDSDEEQPDESDDTRSSADATAVLGENDLLAMAKSSWNAEALKPIDTRLLASRPLMVIRQEVVFEGGLEEFVTPGSNADKLIAHVKKRSTELLGGLAPFSHSFDFASEAAASFVLSLESFEIAGALRGHESWPRSFGVNIVAMFSDAGILEYAVNKNLGVALYVIVLLPDGEHTSVDLGDIEDAVPGIDGIAMYFDSDSKQVKSQAWSNGERDTGYLEAVDGNGDEEDYCYDDKVGRRFLAEMLKRLEQARP